MLKGAALVPDLAHIHQQPYDSATDKYNNELDTRAGLFEDRLS